MSSSDRQARQVFVQLADAARAITAGELHITLLG